MEKSRISFVNFSLDNYTHRDKVRDFAEFTFNQHEKRGLNYDGQPYSVHLIIVMQQANEFIHHIAPDSRLHVFLAALGHDLIEDCSLSYNDVKNASTELAADIVYNVTNELGKNRKEKAERTYPKIKACTFSTYVKLCDRIANAAYSMLTGSSMRSVYLKEHASFKEALYTPGVFDDMWEKLDSILSEKK